MMKERKIVKGLCPVMGYEMQSTQCTNCKYNRVKNVQAFYYASKSKIKTTGSVCVAPDKLSVGPAGENGVPKTGTPSTPKLGTIHKHYV